MRVPEKGIVMADLVISWRKRDFLWRWHLLNFLGSSSVSMTAVSIENKREVFDFVLEELEFSLAQAQLKILCIEGLFSSGRTNYLLSFQSLCHLNKPIPPLRQTGWNIAGAVFTPNGNRLK